MSETPTDQQLAEWEAAAVRDEMLGRAPKWALAALRALREARDEAERLRERETDTFPATWRGFRDFIREWYPRDVFAADFKDGPAMVGAAHALADLTVERDALRDENRRLREAFESQGEFCTGQTERGNRFLAERDALRDRIEAAETIAREWACDHSGFDDVLAALAAPTKFPAAAPTGQEESRG